MMREIVYDGEAFSVPFHYDGEAMECAENDDVWHTSVDKEVSGSVDAKTRVR